MAFNVDNVSRRVVGDLWSRGLANRIVSTSNFPPDEKLVNFAKEWVVYGKSHLGFRSQGNLIESAYFLENPLEHNVTYCRLAQLLAMGREARKEMHLPIDSVKKYEQVISKGRIDAHEGITLPKITVVTHKIRSPSRDQETIYQAFWHLGIRPLLRISQI